ncbi:MAG: MopE-related protein [Myxococcota bacterium]
MKVRLPRPLLAVLFTAACAVPAGDDKGDTAVDDTGADTGADAVDADEDGHDAAVDCDDADPAVYPGADERCDGVDNDCDDTVDEDDATDAPLWYADIDADGVGDVTNSTAACAQPATHVSTSGDCDDGDAANFPGNVEVCDGADNDCDLLSDEDDAADTLPFYADTDGDGFGDEGTSALACAAPEGFVSDAKDCDDTDATVFPDAPEACDGVDHDCDGLTYEGSSVDVRTWYADFDMDGYGSPDFTADACDVPDGYTNDASDCDDDALETFPGAIELCDDADNDCDGETDEDADGRDVCETGGGDPGGGTTGPFDGTFGDTWEPIASSLARPSSLQGYVPAGGRLHNFESNPGTVYDPETDSWSYLATYAPYARTWNSMTPFAGQLYAIMGSNVYRYTPEDDTWETLAAVTGTDEFSMTESDEDGNIYAYVAEGNLVVYDAVGGGVEYIPTGLGSEYEPRLGYDPTTRGLYFGAFYTPNLYRYDLDSGEITEVTPHPESQLNDIFCSDRSGHIYAAGGGSGTTIWQYTTATDTWAPLPDLPSDHGNNSTCSVAEDGWLYVGTDSSAMYRLALY